MLGAVIPKDISICSVVEEIARQIDHFTRERARLCLFSVWHSRVHYSATRTSFATIFDVSESPIHRLSYTVLFVSIIVVVVEKRGRVSKPVHLPSLKIQILGKILKLRILT